MDSTWDSESTCCRFQVSVLPVGLLCNILGQDVNSMPASAWRGDGHHKADTCLRHTIEIQWCPSPVGLMGLKTKKNLYITCSALGRRLPHSTSLPTAALLHL